MSIGQRIIALRRQKGWTQGQLHLYSGVGRTYISRIERDKHPNVAASVLASLAKALNTTTEYLLGLTDNPLLPDQSTMPSGELEWSLLERFRDLSDIERNCSAW